MSEDPTTRRPSMMRLLFIVSCMAFTDASESSFWEVSASSASVFKSIVFARASRLKCAQQCLLEGSMCEGFHLETASSGQCKLYDKICFIGTGFDVYYGRRDLVGNPTIQTNLALGKPASQSSTNYGGVASFGNDGIYPNTDTGYFHTRCDFGNWWRVDIQSAACITAVHFMNRGHNPYSGVRQRANNIAVTVSLLEEDIMDTGDNRCGYIQGAAEDFDNLVSCGHPIVGRYVQLQLLNVNCFHLYEVEVHGY